MKKILFIGIALLLVMALSGGGVFAYFKFFSGKAQASVPKPEKPSAVYFAELSDLVVSIPDDAGDPPSDMVDITLQFQTGTPDAVADFSTIEPVIRAELINLVMRQTAKTLTDQNVRSTLQDQSLTLVNQVMTSRHYAQSAPFAAAFITNLVVQD